MNNDFKLVVFDWDGTLMDSEAKIVACLRSAVADLGLPDQGESRYRNIIGLGLAEALSSLFPDHNSAVHAELVEIGRAHV